MESAACTEALVSFKNNVVFLRTEAGGFMDLLLMFFSQMSIGSIPITRRQTSKRHCGEQTILTLRSPTPHHPQANERRTLGKAPVQPRSYPGLISGSLVLSDYFNVMST